MNVQIRDLTFTRASNWHKNKAQMFFIPPIIMVVTISMIITCIRKEGSKSKQYSGFLWLHSVHHHQSRVDVPFKIRITGSFLDPLDRQLQERVNITNFKGAILMNRRNEMGGVRVERTRHQRWAPLARV